jgi:hypothetical protein
MLETHSLCQRDLSLKSILWEIVDHVMFVNIATRAKIARLDQCSVLKQRSFVSRVFEANLYLRPLGVMVLSVKMSVSVTLKVLEEQRLVLKIIL